MRTRGSKHSVVNILLAFAVLLPFAARVLADDAPAAPAEKTATPPTSGSQDQKQDQKDEEATLKPGVIASIATRPGNAATVVNSGSAAPGDEIPPVSASVNRIKKDSCEVRVTNNHEKNAYTLNYAVEGTDAKGRVISKMTYTSTLKPKESTTKSLTCAEGLNMQVTLRSGKKA